MKAQIIGFTALAFIVIMNLRMKGSCDVCRRPLRRANPFSQAKFCSSCGAAQPKQTLLLQMTRLKSELSSAEVSGWKKARTLAAIVISGWMLGVFAYGIAIYPDAPIKQCGQGAYCGKAAQPRTLDEYNAFIAWQRTFFVSWAAGALSLFFLGRNGES